MTSTPRTKPEPFELPDTTDLASVNAAEVAIIRLAAQGHLRSREALRFSRMLDHRRRAISDYELEEELVRLEQESRQRREKGT
jgi:hypothetical protein